MTDTLRAYPQAYRWDDTMCTATALRPGATSPTLAAFKGGIHADQYDSNDGAHGGIQLPHQNIDDPEVRLHIHFGFNQTTTNGQTVIFEIEWTWAPVNGDFSNVITSQSTYTISGNKNNKHLVHTVVSPVLTGATPSSIILFCVRRNGGTTSVNPFIFFVDGHYQKGRFGSVNEFDYNAG